MKNFQDYTLTLFNQANHTIEKFNTVMLATSGSPSPNFNIISDLDPGSANHKDSDLKMALSRSQEYKNPFFFIEKTDHEHKNEAILSAYDFIPAGKVTWVSINHDHYKHQQDAQGALKVVRVQDPETFGVWCDIIDQNPGLSAGTCQSVFGPATPGLFHDHTKNPIFILYDGDTTPVAVSQLFLPEDLTREAGHYSWTTLAEHRNKGYMSFLVREMVNLAKSRGYKSSIAQCHESSLKLAERIGFKAEYTLDIYCDMTSKIKKGMI